MTPGRCAAFSSMFCAASKSSSSKNALLRQQLIVAARRVKKPQFRPSERMLLVALSAMFAHWRQALVLVQPETLLRWHRDLFRRLWTWRSKLKLARSPRLSKDVIALIRIMALDNRLWGAERIHGELLKLGFSVATSTIQGYIARFRSTPRGQSWSTFLRNQAAGIWSCDLFEVRDLSLRAHYVFVVMHLETRRLLLATSTAEPTSGWLAQQLRNLTPPGLGPKFLIRDNDCKFGRCFDDVAGGAGIQYHPDAEAGAEGQRALRAGDRVGAPRMPRPHPCFERTPSAARPRRVPGLFQYEPATSGHRPAAAVELGRAGARTKAASGRSSRR